MAKRFLTIVFLVVLVFNLSSCDSEEQIVQAERTPIVCVEADSNSILPAREYCKAKGYELVECGSETDCAVMVDGGKYDYFITDNFVKPEIIENNNLTVYEKCDYIVDYRMIFSKNKFKLCNKINASIEELNNNGTLEKIKTEGYQSELSAGEKLYILCDPAFEKQLYLDDDGEIKGVNADIVKAICDNAGFTPILVSGEQDELFLQLGEGEGDAVLYFGRDFSGFEPYYLVSEPYAKTEYCVYKSNAI